MIKREDSVKGGISAAVDVDNSKINSCQSESCQCRYLKKKNLKSVKVYSLSKQNGNTRYNKTISLSHEQLFIISRQITSYHSHLQMSKFKMIDYKNIPVIKVKTVP